MGAQCDRRPQPQAKRAPPDASNAGQPTPTAPPSVCGLHVCLRQRDHQRVPTRRARAAGAAVERLAPSRGCGARRFGVVHPRESAGSRAHGRGAPVPRDGAVSDALQLHAPEDGNEFIAVGP